MKITLHNIGKRYNRDWIFRNVALEFETGANYAIQGANGSGKSTLLQVIAGFVIPSEGKIDYKVKGADVPQDEIYRHLSIASPYLELIEDFTFRELVAYQARMKPFVAADLPGIAGLEAAQDKQIKYYSSGMKQKVKLALAILSDCPLLLLDEPLSNLDKNAADWYREMIALYASDKLVLVCSNNQPDEYAFCSKIIRLEDFKP